jgi:hypothetical protein
MEIIVADTGTFAGNPGSVALINYIYGIFQP